MSWQVLCLAAFIAAAAVIARRPDVLLNAQFYAEDGAVWYADAYNLGWIHALGITAGGYLNSLQRLVAAFSLLFPLRYAPLVMNVFGILIQALPAFFLLTRRCSNWWPLRVRVLQAAIYIAIPNSSEIHVVLTNAPFHFALLTFLVAVAAPPSNLRWKIFDVVVLAIGALSGPFCIVLLPLVLVFWWLRREHWSLVIAAILAPLVAAQGAELLSSGYASRAPGELGATPMMFLRLLTGHVYVGAIHGRNAFAIHGRPEAVFIVTLLGTAVLAYCLLRSSIELRLFILFSMILFAASLSKPLVAGPHPQWQLLALDRGARYWFFPTLALLWSVLWCATQRNSKPFRVFGLVALVAMLNGVVRDWRYNPYTDEHFQEHVKRFDSAPVGAVVQIPIFPDGTVVQLKKKSF
ncbi:MAG TPA: hypothetical protein VK604_15655 [Bryobacteraceae bacterium]|nr:hypothetical protein [Bryobacteraceae bacterium]